MSNFRPPRELAPVGGSPPISSDPPFHHDARRLLLAAFTRTAVTKQEPATRAFCHSLIDAFTGQDVVDAATEYAQHIPVGVVADMLGFPPQDGPQFRELLGQVHDHIGNPRGDLTTYLINAELHGRKLDPAHVVGTMALLLIAGIDTTWSAIGASLWHRGWSRKTCAGAGPTSGPMTGSCCRSRRPTVIRRSSTARVRSSSTARVNRHAAFGLGIHR